MASFLSTLFGGGAEREAAERNRQLLQQGQQAGLGYLNTGLDKSSGYLTDAATSLGALGTKYGAGSTLALDAYGANGADGNARALAAFQAGPGYQFAQDQGQQAVERRRAISGGYDSGNTDIDLLKMSQGLANQEYGNWRNGLSQFISPELAATQGQAGALGSLGNLYQQDATNRVNLQNSTTSGGISANNQQAAGESAGARNLLGAGLSLASLAAGGGFGFGGGAAGTMNYGGQTWPMFGR